MGLRVDRYDGVDQFLGAAGAFLEAREAEHNLIFGICSTVRSSPELFESEPARFAVVTDGGNVVAATLRTPPYNQVLSEVDDLATVDVVVDSLRDEPLPGVLGPTVAAARFAERWTAATGVTAHRATAERIFRLTRVIRPRPVTGRWRLAASSDRELIADWLVAFQEEAVPHQPPLDDVGATADRWIAQRGRVLYLWEDALRPVCAVGAGGETPNGVRIGPVYTPPELRGRGYASNLTAAASRDQLGQGRTFCFLFTDLANPTSNRIYQAIGYEPVADVDEYRFGH